MCDSNCIAANLSSSFVCDSPTISSNVNIPPTSRNSVRKRWLPRQCHILEMCNYITHPLAEEIKIDIACNCKLRQVPTMYVILIHVVIRARNKLAQSAKCCSNSEHVMLLHCMIKSFNISLLTVLEPLSHRCSNCRNSS